MEQSPFGESNRFSASQKIPRRFITPVTSASHLVPILSQINPVHNHIPVPKDPS